jgi:hypothetical protein
VGQQGVDFSKSIKENIFRFDFPEQRKPFKKRKWPQDLILTLGH